MALPICIEIESLPDPFEVTLPGGVDFFGEILLFQTRRSL